MKPAQTDRVVIGRKEYEGTPIEDALAAPSGPEAAKAALERFAVKGGKAVKRTGLI